jgi:hypothetical protein
VQALTWAAQHRFLTLGIGLMSLVVAATAAAVGVWFFVLRSPATQVDLRTALRLYREDQKQGRNGNSHLPPSGVYRYRTTGGEQLSLGGISRSFPDATDMIVTQAAGCAAMRWEPLEQHMEGLVECPQKDGALLISSALSYEQIAGTTTTSVINCPANMYFVPPDPSAGKRWHATCHSKGQAIGVSGQVIGLSGLDVGGTEVPSLHLHLTLSFSGSESGTNPNDYWVSLQNGLILRQRETVQVSQSAGPLGSVRYTEQMAIALTSVAPLR